MSREQVPPAAAGKPCPYCRFPLKEQMEAHRCDTCRALHHGDCWSENGGCAVLGCTAKAAAAQAMPIAVQPPGSAAGAPVPGPSFVQARETRARLRTSLVLIAVIAVAVAGAGGYLLASSRSTSSTPSAASAERPAPAETHPAVPVDREQGGLAELEDIITLAGEGRAAVLDHRYAEGVENRSKVISRLERYSGPTARLDIAAQRLTRAMEASLAADRDYEAGTDARANDALAERQKERFLTLYNQIAREHGARTYREIDL